MWVIGLIFSSIILLLAPSVVINVYMYNIVSLVIIIYMEFQTDKIPPVIDDIW